MKTRWRRTKNELGKRL